MLETIRVYADERLGEAGERATLHAALARHYVELVEANEPLLRTAGQMPVIDLFDSEYDNLVDVLRRAIDSSDVETAHRLTGALFWYWLVRGNNVQVNEFVAAVVAFGDRVPPAAAAAFRVIHSMDFTTVTYPAAVDPTELIDECVRTGAIERFPGLAIAVPMLAFFSRDMELAAREVRRVLAGGDAWSRAAAHWVEGFLLGDAGDLAGAEQARKDALAGFEEVGDRWGMAMTLAMYADELSRAGESAEAIRIYRRGLALAAELRSEDDVVQQLCRLAMERSRIGDLVGAARELAEADAVAERSRNPQLRNMIVLSRIELALKTGELDVARREIDWMRASMDELPFPQAMAAEWLARFEGKLAIAEGRLDDASALLAGSVQSISDRRDMPDLAVVAELFALLRHRQGETEAAATLLGVSQALRGAFDRGDPDLRTLVAELTTELGDQRYGELFELGSRLSKEDAAQWLLRDAGL
jgi:tetratricopeptide (TPR) repeat protein